MSFVTVAHMICGMASCSLCLAFLNFFLVLFWVWGHTQWCSGGRGPNGTILSARDWTWISCMQDERPSLQPPALDFSQLRFLWLRHDSGISLYFYVCFKRWVWGVQLYMAGERLQGVRCLRCRWPTLWLCDPVGTYATSLEPLPGRGPSPSHPPKNVTLQNW